MPSLSRIKQIWTNTVILVCTLMVWQEGLVHVVGELTFVDPMGNTHLLDGYEVHNDFMSSVELFIGEKVKSALTYALQYSKSDSGVFLSNIDSLNYRFLQFFHSIFTNDFRFANFLLDLPTPEHLDFSNWLISNINIPEEHVFKVLKSLSEGSRIGLSPLPNILTKEIILLNTKYNYFQSSCSRGDLAIVEWAIHAGLPLDQFGLEGLQAAWENKHWEIVKVLVGNRAVPLTNITVFSQWVNERNETLLHFAAETDNSKYIISLLDAGAKINVVDVFGKSPLQRAIEAFKTPVVRLLLSKGANMNHETESGDTMLHLTARMGNYEAAELLINEDFPLDRKNEDGFTAYNDLERVGVSVILNQLLTRCSYFAEGEEAIKELFQLQYKLKIEKICVFSLKYFSEEGNPAFLRNLTEAVKIFLKKGAKSDLINKQKDKLLLMAIDNKLSDAVNFILETGITFLEISKSLHRAVLTDDVTIVKYLLNAGADMTLTNTDGLKPIHIAASNGKLQAVNILLKNGDDVNSKTLRNETVLQIAIHAGQVEVVTLLLDEGANIRWKDTEGRQAIHDASSRGQEHTLQLLLAKGASPNARDNSKSTPLFDAVLHRHFNIAKTLLDHGSSVNARDSSGRTPLHRAVWGGSPQVVSLLLNRGADVNSKDIYNKTALFEASYYGLTDIVKVLLERGADVSIAGIGQWTPLLIASRGGFKEVVKLLLEKGADVCALTYKGLRALDKAKLSHRSDVIKLLIEHGAEKCGTPPPDLNQRMDPKSNIKSSAVKLMVR